MENNLMTLREIAAMADALVDSDATPIEPEIFLHLAEPETSHIVLTRLQTGD